MGSKRIDKLLQWDRRHILHPAYAVGNNRGIIFEKAYDTTLLDTEGKEYIDFCSQLTCINLGYSQNELVAAAAEQMSKLAYTTLHSGFSNIPTIECGMKLARLTPKGLDHFMFTAGGSESVELAFKLSRIYWSNKGINKYKIVSLYNAYHGSTFGAGSSSGLGKGSVWRGIAPTVSGFIHIPPYYCYRCMFGKKYLQCGIHCAHYLAEVIEREGPETVAAFIAEPAMGAGGMIPPPAEYWPIVRNICDKYDVLLIADEVMTGFCRTGKMFAVEHWGIKPDIMTMAKGITSAYFPVGAIAFNEMVYKVLKGSRHGGITYGGHPVGLALATKAIEIYLRENIVGHVLKLSEHLMRRLNIEFRRLSCVGEITGLGLMGGIEIVADKRSRKMFGEELAIMARIQDEALSKGLYLRTISNAVGMSDRIEWSPPLTISIEEVNKALDILKPILAAISKG